MNNRFRDHRKIIHTSHARLEVCTLAHFLRLIKRMEIMPEATHGAFYIKETGRTSYRTVEAPLLDISLHASALLSLASASSPILYEPKGHLLQMVGDAARRSVLEYGHPEHLVRIARRLWAVLAVEDFLIFQSGNRSALACLNPNRTQLISVDRAPKKTKVVTGGKCKISVNGTDIAYPESVDYSFDHSSIPYVFGSYKPEDMNFTGEALYVNPDTYKALEKMLKPKDPK